MSCFCWTYLGTEPAPFFTDSDLLKHAVIAQLEALLVVVGISVDGGKWFLVPLDSTGGYCCGVGCWDVY